MDQVQQYGQTLISLPAKYSDNLVSPQRASKYGEVVSVPVGKGVIPYSDEGSYFMASNPTPGTGIAGVAAAATADDTKSLLLIANNYSATDGRRIYLDTLTLQTTVAGTNGTNVRYMAKTEPASTASRYTSGGSTITPVNPNQDSGTTTSATVRFGALVTTAASVNARLVANGLLRPVITVVGDVYVFDFGAQQYAGPSGVLNGTNPVYMVEPQPPVIIGPGQQFVFCLYAASQTVASQFEFELTWWER